MRHRFLVVAGTFVLLLAACGGSDDTSPRVASLTDSTDAPAADEDSGETPTDEEALMALTQCLRDQGVDIEDPTVDADGNLQLGQPNFENDGEGRRPGGGLRAAFEACEEHLESVTLGFGRGLRNSTEFQDTMLEYAACMREQGIDLPDPDFSAVGPGNDDGGEGDGNGPEGGPGRGIFGDLDPEDPAFHAAQEQCGDILAGFGPGGGPFGGPGPAGDDG